MKTAFTAILAGAALLSSSLMAQEASDDAEPAAAAEAQAGADQAESEDGAATEDSAAQDWFPSTYGADDELGAANLLSPELVLKAAELVTEGKAYPLGIPVGANTPGFGVRELDINIFMPGQEGGSSIGPNKMTYVDDVIMGWVGLGSQIDGLGHLGIDNVFYNGNTPADYVTTGGLTKMGIHNIPPIVTRGLVIDVAGARGVDVMEAGEYISLDEIQSILEDSDLTVEEGDVVLLHTGWLSLIESEPERFAEGEPGIDRVAAAWLAEQGAIAVGADTWGLDAVPGPEGTAFSAHQELLAKNGVYILENMATQQLVDDGVTEFMFVLGQPRLEGAVQSIINPVAIR
ncbi:cyclase family protein [Paracoccus sediminicola]|uniref:cyclase family protein n=1 Tax=Paracoccus sediminicola TaxID=3017783 RepID=UPI0022F0713F|nr:cyclase family protein [Paracoccus sediminicola]WBU56147.1 cyclase family protein [Paracoccus sediminicola]